MAWQDTPHVSSIIIFSCCCSFVCLFCFQRDRIAFIYFCIQPQYFLNLGTSSWGERRNVSQDVFFPYAFLPASDRTDSSIALSCRYPNGIDKQYLSLANQTSCLQGTAASSQLLHPEGREEGKPEGFQKRQMTWLSKVQSSIWLLLQPFPTLGKVGKCHFPFFAAGWKKESSPCSVFHRFCLFNFPFTGGQSWEISLQHRHLLLQLSVLALSLPDSLHRTGAGIQQPPVCKRPAVAACLQSTDFKTVLKEVGKREGEPISLQFLSFTASPLQVLEAAKPPLL